MSIAQLLSVNGARTPRYITVAGRTVFGSVTATATGLLHPEHGPVTPVSRHTFHGGADASDADEPRAVHWWEEPGAMDGHLAAMEHSFPGFTYIPGDDQHAPCWTGVLDTGRGAFRVGIVLRVDQGLPFIRVLSRQRLGRDCGGRFVRSPHLYDSGALCVADADDWDPSVHTAATATAWAAHWLAAFTEWRITLKWPITGFDAA